MHVEKQPFQEIDGILAKKKIWVESMFLLWKRFFEVCFTWVQQTKHQKSSNVIEGVGNAVQIDFTGSFLQEHWFQG